MDCRYICHTHNDKSMKNKMISIIAAGILCSGCVFTQDIDTTRLELPAIESTDYLVEYQGYVSSYDAVTKNPEWVAYELTKEETYGDAVREGKFFSPDDRVLLPQPDDYDYRGSGWTRGHLAPAADFRWSDDAMWETFHFTNCCPQDEELNNGMWNTLEKKCRTWARRFGNIYIVTGPIVGENRYGTIGDSHVVIPDAFFKAVMVHDGNRWQSIAFVMQNRSYNDNMQNCAMSVDELEELTGFDFFTAMEDDSEAAAEKSYKLSFWKL